jgi:hypothetical protein
MEVVAGKLEAYPTARPGDDRRNPILAEPVSDPLFHADFGTDRLPLVRGVADAEFDSAADGFPDGSDTADGSDGADEVSSAAAGTSIRRARLARCDFATPTFVVSSNSLYLLRARNRMKTVRSHSEHESAEIPFGASCHRPPKTAVPATGSVVVLTSATTAPPADPPLHIGEPRSRP